MPTSPDDLACRVQPALFWPPLVEDEDGNLVELVEAIDPETGATIDRTREAKLLCSVCPLRVKCLDGAIRRSEEFGIWGGMGSDLRLWIRSQYLAGPEAYRTALERAFNELDIWARKPGAERVIDEAPGVCPRCGARIRVGKKGNPIDRNGPGATCGKASTYNRGCRCVPCCIAKGVSDAKRSVGQ